MLGFYGDKCDRCHSWLLGLTKNMFLGYGLTKDWSERCKYKHRTRTEDLGKMKKTIEERKTVARCPACGRKQEADSWVTMDVEKVWKDGACEK